MAAIEKNPTSLRERQKSQRRRDILDAGKKLFETEGYDASTMARIAEKAGVSPPTVFNYFGSKDELIVAIVLEIHEQGREYTRSWRPKKNQSRGDLLGEVLCIYAELSMEKAGRRIWRYAEATNIRQPNSPVTQLYDQIETYHIQEVSRFLYEAQPAPPDTTPDDWRETCDFLASVAYRCWNARFHQFIRDDSMKLDSHKRLVRREMRRLSDLTSLDRDL